MKLPLRLHDVAGTREGLKSRFESNQDSYDIPCTIPRILLIGERTLCSHRVRPDVNSDRVISSRIMSKKTDKKSYTVLR